MHATPKYYLSSPFGSDCSARRGRQSRGRIHRSARRSLVIAAKAHAPIPCAERKIRAQGRSEILSQPWPELQRLRDVFDYNPQTGVFTWLVSTSKKMKAGSTAGCLNAIGYVFLCLDSRRYLAHRVAWFYMTGEVPAGLIDHVNGQKADNRWSNLRQATPSQNQQNKPGYRPGKLKGVIETKSGRFVASIRSKGMSIHLGTFDDQEAAHAAYCAASAVHHKEFSNTESIAP